MEIPDTDPSSIDQAIDFGFQRTRGQFGIEIEQLENFKPQLISVLESWPGEAHPRFVMLFVELCAIAQISRLANREPVLTDKQISGFLRRCLDFFNCFAHR